MATDIGIINSRDYDKIVKKLRAFFDKKGYTEVHTQSRLSILAACEDPHTISTYNYAGQVWPLPQTGQMWLEYELLNNPHEIGFYCVSTSYRNEPNPIPGRHDKIFPMFEFELKGDLDALLEMEKELLDFLGFNKFYEERAYPVGDYEDICEEYSTNELEHSHEQKLREDYGPVYFVKNFPNFSSPFWNMKQSDSRTHAKKIDVILNGMETIGSAERSNDPKEMRHQFHNISGGDYANILFSNFTRKRVEQELDQFLGYHFFTRSGGGIGLTRLIKAMKACNLLE